MKLPPEPLLRIIVHDLSSALIRWQNPEFVASFTASKFLTVLAA